MNTYQISAFLSVVLSFASCSAGDKDKTAMKVATEVPVVPAGQVIKTDAEWEKELTPEQYRILRESGTERPNGEVYKAFKHQGKGLYLCAGCKVVLFSSDHKFDSGCGWPSFYDPAKADHVVLKKDVSMGAVRTEVTCAKCGGHLGHVFEGEGYKTPTDKRYCINGGGLIFVPASDAQGAK
jgi:peptide-methionine (R)-S-oxide reductase